MVGATRPVTGTGEVPVKKSVGAKGTNGKTKRDGAKAPSAAPPTAESSNSVLLSNNGLRKVPPGKLDIAALARVVSPLSPAQREAAVEAGANIDQMAVRAWLHEPFSERRAGESDEAYSLRVRHHEALLAARWMVLEIEALRPTAEGAPTVYAHDLEMLLTAVEQAKNQVLGGARNRAKWRTIDAVRGALEVYRRKRVTQSVELEQDDAATAAPMSFGERAWRWFWQVRSDVDFARDYAIRRDPALAVVSVGEWARAMERWPGLPSEPIKWATVVHDLLESVDKRIDGERGGKRPASERLTDARDYRSIVRTWELGQSL